MKCVRCGTELTIHDKFCLGCGFEVGREYEKKESSETLESLMEMPVEEVKAFDGNTDEVVEELDVDSNIEYNESIDGNIVNVSTSNVLEGEVLGPTKKKKKPWFILIVLIFLLGGFGIYIIKDYFENYGDGLPVQPSENIKPNIINYPTSLYSFGNNFIIKINSLWNLLDKKEVSEGTLETIYFISGNSTLTLNLYNYYEDALNQYIKLNEITTNYEEIKINDVKYYLFNFYNNKIYVKIVDNYLYAFEFFYTDNIDDLINDVMNNVNFYN